MRAACCSSSPTRDVKRPASSARSSSTHCAAPSRLLFYRDTLGIEAEYSGLGRLARRLEEAMALGAVLGTEQWPEAQSPEGMLLTRVVGQSLGSQLRSIWLQSDEKRGKVVELLTLPLERAADLRAFTETLQLILD